MYAENLSVLADSLTQNFTKSQTPSRRQYVYYRPLKLNKTQTRERELNLIREELQKNNYKHHIISKATRQEEQLRTTQAQNKNHKRISTLFKGNNPQLKTYFKENGYSTHIKNHPLH